MNRAQPLPLSKMSFPAAGVVAVLLWLALLPAGRAGVLNIVGSSAENLPVSDAAQILRSGSGLEIHINTTGGSNAGIAAVGVGTAEIGMSTRPLTAEDRADAPNVNFKQIYLGQQVVAVAVAKDVWEGGVHAMRRTQMRAIYEGKIKNWKQLGGPDEAIVFFNPEEGRGVWEMMVQWIYGDSKKAPLGHFPTVGSNEEARNSVEFTRGSMSLLAPLWIDGKSAYALALEGDDNKAYFPAMPNYLSKKYPLMKPMYLVTNDTPTLNVKIMVDFMLGEKGIALFKKYGFIDARTINAADPNFAPSD